MPDLSANDSAQIAEAARLAGAKPERAHLFARTTDLSAVPRDAGGQLDAAALAAAVGVAVADAPELTITGAAALGGPRRAPAYGQGVSTTGAVPAGAAVRADDAEVAAVLARMQRLAGLPVTGATS